MSDSINKKCGRCRKKCKQSDKVKIVNCPSFESVDEPPKLPAEIKPKRKKKEKSVDKK